MNKKRPVNLNLFTIKQPIPAIVSILHRVSGVFLFLLFPFLLAGFHYSLHSADDFNTLYSFFSSPLYKFFLWVVLASLIFHLIAGIRHLLMDLHVGEELWSGRLSAKLVLLVALVAIVLIGMWIW